MAEDQGLDSRWRGGHTEHDVACSLRVPVTLPTRFEGEVTGIILS